MSDTKTKRYQVDPRANGGELFTVLAQTYEQAALKAARRIFPHYRRVVSVNRETGDPGSAGMWQAYSPIGCNTRSSRGSFFHVSEA